jgi:hypothetical protein
MALDSYPTRTRLGVNLDGGNGAAVIDPAPRPPSP